MPGKPGKMRYTSTLVVGGGQAGLAMSRCLRDRGIDHVVLERARVAERWRSERWESLRLLTPNWQSRLPGFRYDGPDPDGYMTMPEVVDYLQRFARVTGAPVETGTAVRSIKREGDRYDVTTSGGRWRAENVVVASGHCDVPMVPALASRLSPELFQIVPTAYRAPRQLPDGGVLVVGASASGLQLADEIHQSGRPVTLAVGRHTRVPRMYRGRDILWWFDAMGIFDDTPDRVYDIEVSRRQTSLQLIGTPRHDTLDLPLLASRGVRLVGRLVAADRTNVAFDDALVAYTAAADIRLAQLLRRIDNFIAASGLAGTTGPPEPFVPFCWPAPAPICLDLRAAGIRTVVWATGFKRDYSWLRVNVLDERGEIRHQGGITQHPGLYVLGLHFMRRRKSSFIDGVGDDARELAAHIEARTRGARPRSQAVQESPA